MSEIENNSLPENNYNETGNPQLDKARDLASSLSIEDYRSGEWFLKLMRMTVSSYDRNAKASYFQQKYPGMQADKIADKMISLASRYSALAGGVAGAVVTAEEIGAIFSLGVTALPMLPTFVIEVVSTVRILMNLVLDLSVVYDIQLDKDDPEDMVMIIGYAVGVVPTDALSAGVRYTAAEGARNAVKRVVNKETLALLQDFGRKVGLKILQRDVISIAVPFAAILTGSSFNYLTTRSIGQITKAHFKNRNGVTNDLRALVSRRNIYDLIFPASINYMAKVDGKYVTTEEQLYNAILSRMSFEPYEKQEFDKLQRDEESILGAISKLEDDDSKYTLVELLSLMAIIDGKLVTQERDFLSKVAQKLTVDIDLDGLELRSKEFLEATKASWVQESISSLRSMIDKASHRYRKSTTPVSENVDFDTK